MADNSMQLSYDVVVCGGGPAGIAASIAAARKGSKTLLIERFGRLGGMATSGLVQPIMGAIESPFVMGFLDKLGGRHVDFERFDIVAADEVLNSGAEVLLHTLIVEAKTEGKCVTAIRCAGKNGYLDIQGKVFIDATGDGDVAAFSGAEFEKGRPGDDLMQPVSIMYRISGVDEERAFQCGCEKQALVLQIGDRTWHDIVAEGQKNGELPENIGIVRTYFTGRSGERGVNATQVNYVDGLDVRDLTRAEIEGRKQAYTVLDFLQKHAPGYEDAYISAMPAVIGVRETRRVLGVDYLTREDVSEGRKRDDAVVRGANFPIDIHNPDGSGQAEGLPARAKPYDIPYGCLVPKTIDGLLLAGRCISGGHDAHASYRVMAIAMAIGAAAGTAASLAVKGSTQPRGVDVREIQNALSSA